MGIKQMASNLGNTLYIIQDLQASGSHYQHVWDFLNFCEKWDVRSKLTDILFFICLSFMQFCAQPWFCQDLMSKCIWPYVSISKSLVILCFVEKSYCIKAHYENGKKILSKTSSVEPQNKYMNLK